MNSENKYYVYALVDPINQLPFYIGKGCGNRAYLHVEGKDTGNKKKVRYIQNIRALGFEPEVHFIKKDMCEQDAYDFESYCIKDGKSYLPLTNVTGIKQPPSRKGSKWSKESIAKRSATVRQKRINGYKKVISEEQKQKISKKLTGRKLSDSHRKRISEAVKERWSRHQSIQGK